MNFTEMVLLSAALSIDGLSIGASCGLGGIRIPARSVLIITAISMLVTGAAVAGGSLLGGVLPETAGKIIGGGLLIILGLYMIAGEMKNNRDRSRDDHPGIIASSARLIGSVGDCDPDDSRIIDGREACVIGLALSADSFAAGISAGMGGREAFLVPVMCTVFQILFLLLGEKCAVRLRRIKMVDSRVFGAAAGVILIVTAVLRFVL